MVNYREKHMELSIPNVSRVFIIIHLIKNIQKVEKYRDTDFLMDYVNIKQLFLSNSQDAHHTTICKIKNLEAT